MDEKQQPFLTDDTENWWQVPRETQNEGRDIVCAESAVSAAMSAASCCNCTFQDTQFLAGSCGATFTLFMGLVEYLVRSKDDIADQCNRPGRDSIKVSRAIMVRVLTGAWVVTRGRKHVPSQMLSGSIRVLKFNP
jgi:hypothetical protein